MWAGTVSSGADVGRPHSSQSGLLKTALRKPRCSEIVSSAHCSAVHYVAYRAQRTGRAPQHTCKQDPGPDEQTVVAQCGRTHGSKRATRCSGVPNAAAQRTVVRGAVGQVRVVGRPRAAVRFALLQRRRWPSHIWRSSAPGLAHICAGAGTGTGAAQAGSCQHASPCCNTVHCIATRRALGRATSSGTADRAHSACDVRVHR